MPAYTAACTSGTQLSKGRSLASRSPTSPRDTSSSRFDDLTPDNCPRVCAIEIKLSIGKPLRCRENAPERLVIEVGKLPKQTGSHRVLPIRDIPVIRGS